MTKIEYLKNKKSPETIASLAEALEQYLRESVTPRQKQQESIEQAWEHLVPVELSRHCTIKEITGGTLKVAVDSPIYMYELRLCADELLGEIRNNRTSNQIGKIKIVLEKN